MPTTLLFPHLQSLHIETIALDGNTVIMTVAGTSVSAPCPLCQTSSSRVHSQYQRTVADLPISGRQVAVVVHVRRFRCVSASCLRRIFAERLPDLVAPHARKSQGLRQALEHIGFVAGGEVGARLARQLGMPTSPDTLLRLIRAAPCPDPGQPRIIGLDDWAYKRGLRYGTIVCDLERHRAIDLLPERSAASTITWLEGHPAVKIIARDRSGLYADAATRGAPQAMQVVDRWHLVDNLADALEKFLLQHGTLLKEAAAAAEPGAVAPGAVPVATDVVYQGKRRTLQPRLWEQRAAQESERRVAGRRATYDQVQDLHAKGATPMDIARMVGVTRATVYRYLQGGPPQRKQRARRGQQRVLEPWEPYLLKRWEEGCHTATRLWREICGMGFAYSITCVQRFCALLRLEGPPPRTLQRAASPFTSVRGPSARQVASLFLQRAERRAPEQARYLEQLLRRDPTVASAYALTQKFLTMVRELHGERLDAWIEAVREHGPAELRRFALGLRDDFAAVRAGLTLVQSNGQTEGFINKLKLTKRSMYGRGKFDLLRQRMLYAS
ncbi:MAG: ISL3 family transposase [Actinomycetota bacterium]|nr:ISL3 family transposase [Actinomycetota bacterium]